MTIESVRRAAVWWLEDAAGEPQPGCPPLAGPITAGVCVVGGGFTGLWSAIHLRLSAPDVSVVLVEREHCGFGASGRNGGWVTSWLDEFDGLAKRFGPELAPVLATHSSEAIGEIGRFVERHGIECDFRRAGAFLVARSARQEASLEEASAAVSGTSFRAQVRRVDPRLVRQKTGTALPRAALCLADAASVHPGRLVLGLRRVALELGVRIFEGTPVLGWDGGEQARVFTPAGSVDAGRVVLALGAYSGAVPGLRRAFVPVGSHMLSTEPVPDLIGSPGNLWSAGELLGDARLMVHYAQVARGGRLIFGQGGGAIGLGSQVRGRHYRNPGFEADLVGSFRHWFPQLAGVRIDRAWGGAVDRTPSHLPIAGALDADGTVLYALGYSGNGVGPSYLLGKVLAARAIGADLPEGCEALLEGTPEYLPPEPFRSFGGILVRAAVKRSEDVEEAGRHGGFGALLRPLVGAKMPAWMEWRKRKVSRSS